MACRAAARVPIIEPNERSNAPPLTPMPAVAALLSPRDRRMTEILGHAARLFADEGYDGASLRGLARATGISLAGLYHYFQSKEALLYELQRHTLETVLSSALTAAADRPPRVRLEAVIANHLRYFLANRAAMKVLSHEDEVLTGAYAAKIAALKHQYYELCMGLVAAVAPRQGLPRVTPRTAVMCLFGMLNWIYTWHRDGRDPGAEELAAEMTALFFGGWSPAKNNPDKAPANFAKRSTNGHRYKTTNR